MGALRPILILLAAAVAGGCGGDDAAVPEPGPPPTRDLVYRACPLGTRVGELRVVMTAELSSVSGSIAEAVVPSLVPELVLERDGCRLLRRRELRCDPPCAAGMTCGEAGQCLRYPENLSAGTIRIHGLRRAVTMLPRSVGKLYWDSDLPHPAWEPGVTIWAVAEGAEVPAFTLLGLGVPPLLVPAQDWLLETDRPLTLSWTPAPQSPARLRIGLQIDQHGRTPATLVCEVPDVGSVTIAPELVNELLRSGTSGFPRVSFSRQTLESVAMPSGCTELLVAAEIDRSLRVAGHIPCTRDADCPAGRRCVLELQSCQ